MAAPRETGWEDDLVPGDVGGGQAAPRLDGAGEDEIMAGSAGGRHPGWRAAAIAMVAVTAAICGLALVLAILNGHVAQGVSEAAAFAFVAVGTIILVRRPGNQIGLLLCAAGFLMAVAGVATEYAYRSVVAARGSLPASRFAEALLDVLPIAVIGLLVGVLPQLFPTGRPALPWLRWTVWAAWGYIAAGIAGNAFAPQPVEGLPGVSNPYVINAGRPLFAALQAAAGILLIVALAGGLIGIAARWRRSHGDERQQLKWLDRKSVV